MDQTGRTLLTFVVSGIFLVASAPSAVAETTAVGTGTVSGCLSDHLATGFIHDSRGSTAGTLIAGAGDPLLGGFVVVIDNTGVVGGVLCGSDLVTSFTGSWDCAGGTIDMEASGAGITVTFSGTITACDV